MVYSAKLTCWEANVHFDCDCENVTADELEAKLQGYPFVRRSDWEGKEEFTFHFHELASHYTLEIIGK